MRETEYAYAVARIRAIEKKLLSKADLDQLIAADSCDTAVRILTEKGRAEPDADSGYDICEKELSDTWSFLRECVPDIGLFDAIVVGNDFANLKAAVKSKFSGVDAEKYMTCPYLCEPKVIIKAIAESDFGALPDYLSECADKAYHAYTEKQSGQQAEIIIDKACNRAKLKFAEKAESTLLTEIFEIGIAVSDIKTARRCVTTGKTKEFALEVVSGCGKLDGAKLVEAAYAGDKTADLLIQSGLEELAEYADGDFSALEMASDNLITEKAKSYNHEVFGPNPIVAYYYAKLAETKNVRIILSAKASNVPDEVISKRVREIYV